MTPRRRENLKRLLAPRHIAFIGGASAAHAAAQCAQAGFKGQIWGVNPQRKELGGQPCFARCEDLPEAPDAVFLAVPRPAAVETVTSLARIGAGGLVCYTAGFGELGGEGADLEQALIAAAGDLALVGPNCLGLINYLRNAILWPFGHGGHTVTRGIALVSQSGLMGTNLTMNRRSADFAYVVSVGNQAILGVEDFIDVLVDDPAVASIGVYIEGLRSVPCFAAAALRALEAGKPIVALKAGTSHLGAQLTVSHTGSLSGSDKLYQALFDRLGVIRVKSPAALLETLKMMTVAGVPKGGRIAAFTCSGGDSTLLADGVEAHDLELPQPSAATARQLGQHLPPIASPANPLDYTTPVWGKEAALTDAFSAMLRDPYDAALLVQDYMKEDFAADNELYLADTRAFIAATRAAGVPAAICSGLSENLGAAARAVMCDGGVAPLQGIEEALTALGAACRYGAYRGEIVASGCLASLDLVPPPPMAGAGVLIDEWEGKRLLAASGLAVPEGRLATPQTAAAVAASVGFPVAVKLLSTDLPHKTEAGALRLGLSSAREVEQAVRAIQDAVADHAPGLRADRFLVERMVGEPVGELLVGVRRDQQFGQALVLASGGVLVELVEDSRTLLLPCGRPSVLRALESLKVWKLISGYRGRPAGDVDALVEAIMKLIAFAQDHLDNLLELDVNPLMVLPKGAVAADVLLRRVPRESRI